MSHLMRVMPGVSYRLKIELDEAVGMNARVAAAPALDDSNFFPQFV